MSKNILWFVICFVCLTIGSVFIALICDTLNLPSQLGTLFGMLLGAVLAMFYIEKVD